MRYAVKPREATRYGARRPEPSVKPLALLQSLFDKTADGFWFGWLVGLFGNPGGDADELVGSDADHDRLRPSGRPASFSDITYCIRHGIR